MKRTVAGFFLLVVLFMPIALSGCGTTKSVYKKIMPSKPLLKKRVMVISPLDQAGLGAPKVKALMADFITLLKGDGNFLIHQPAKTIPASVKTRPSKYGIVLNPEMADRAKEMGMDVLITAIVHPYEVHSEKKGIWPFRKVRRELEVSMSFNAVDLTTGTLLLNNLESRKLEIPKTSDDLDVLRIEGQINEETDDPVSLINEKELQKAFSKIVKQQASVVAEGLNKDRWSGKILSVDGNSLMINAGSDVGVTTESVFVVFDQGKLIRSPDGRSYHLLGPKIGEIKPLKIMERTASAVPLVGKGFKPGQVIEIKK